MDGLFVPTSRQKKSQADWQGIAEHGGDLSLMVLGIFILASMLLIANSPVQY
ncbi:hypothetical protein C4K39_1159 [Pseudomonas sessilinigenes]|nr:hypothetical protein C4K39_1159 [Pseudomonas sessilinigenes]